MPPTQVSITVSGNPPAINDPPTATINRGNQLVQWTIGTSGWSWSTNPAGIICETNPPNPFVPWPSQAQQPNLVPGTQTYQGNANNPLPPGSQSQTYKYKIKLVNSSNPGQTLSLDPDIENQPSGGGTDEDHGNEDHEKPTGRRV
jgi:hypothetical protein